MKSIGLLAFLLLFSGTSSSAVSSLEFSDSGSPNMSITLGLLKEVYKRIGITVTSKILPAKRALIESSVGQTDGEINRLFRVGEIYPTLKRIPTPIGRNEAVVFSKQFNFTVTDCAALRKYRIAIARGNVFATNCAQGLDFHMLKGASEIVRFIEYGRADITIANKLNFLHRMKKSGVSSIHPLSPPLAIVPMYHYLHEKHRELVPKVDEVLRKMTESGELDRLRKKLTEEFLGSI